MARGIAQAVDASRVEQDGVRDEDVTWRDAITPVFDASARLRAAHAEALR
jgi:hypothetical protein